MTVPTPPRLTGDSELDLRAVIEWAWGLYRELVLLDVSGKRLDAIAAVTKLDAGTATAADAATAANAIITAATRT